MARKRAAKRGRGSGLRAMRNVATLKGSMATAYAEGKHRKVKRLGAKLTAHAAARMVVGKRMSIGEYRGRYSGTRKYR